MTTKLVSLPRCTWMLLAIPLLSDQQSKERKNHTGVSILVKIVICCNLWTKVWFWAVYLPWPADPLSIRQRWGMHSKNCHQQWFVQWVGISRHYSSECSTMPKIRDQMAMSCKCCHLDKPNCLQTTTAAPHWSLGFQKIASYAWHTSISLFFRWMDFVMR